MAKKKSRFVIRKYSFSKFALFVLLAAGVFGFGGSARAQVISGVSGNIVDGDSVTISGSEFGIKNPAAPMRWEDFESRFPGTLLSTFGWHNLAGTGTPSVSTALSYNGNNSGHCYVAHTDDSRCYAYYNFESSQTAIYTSFMFRYDFSGDAAVSPNIKFDRTVSGGYGDAPNRGSTKDNVGSNPYYYQNTGNGIGWSRPVGDGHYESHAANSPGAYHRLESYLQLSSTPDVTDGVWYESVDLDEWMNSTEMTLSSSATATTLNRFLLPFYFGLAAGNVTAYYDDIYIDNTRARVEIGDQPAWGDCAKREIQIPAAWSDNSIIFTTNQGSFPCGTAYLFVVDENGTASAGYPIILGETSDTTSPSRSNSQPTGTLSSGTTSTTISLDTDETAECKYSTAANTDYNDMTLQLTSGQANSHTVTVTDLEDGNSYTYYVKCQDESNNQNTDDFEISFNIASSSITYSISNFINLVSDWLKSESGLESDVNGDGVVNTRDLGIMMSNWQ